MPAPIEIYDDNGDLVAIPTRWEVCWACGGEGVSTAYLGAFTSSDMDELGPEFFEDYASGMYDRPCAQCDGRRVVAEIDTDDATPEQIALFEQDRQAWADVRAMEAAERRAGC